MKGCNFTVPIIKIYETDKYINLLMPCYEGGCLGKLLSNNIKINENCARNIAA